MEDKKPCDHFEYCAVPIIRDKRGEDWTNRFCLSGKAEACQHFELGPAKRKIFEEFQKSPAH